MLKSMLFKGCKIRIYKKKLKEGTTEKFTEKYMYSTIFSTSF